MPVAQIKIEKVRLKAKIVPLRLQQLVTRAVILKGHICTIITSKRFIVVP